MHVSIRWGQRWLSLHRIVKRIPIADTHVIALTAVKEDMPPDDWYDVIPSPVKSMMKLLGDDVSDVTFASPPWGRSFQCQGKSFFHRAPTLYSFMLACRSLTCATCSEHPEIVVSSHAQRPNPRRSPVIS